MKKITIMAAILLLAAGLIGAKEIDFAENYDAALKLAVEKNQKVLITVSTDW